MASNSQTSIDNIADIRGCVQEIASWIAENGKLIGFTDTQRTRIADYSRVVDDYHADLIGKGLEALERQTTSQTMGM